MRKNSFKILVIFLAILTITSCNKEWLDVNEDPNNAKSATAELVLPSGIVSAGAEIGGYYNLLGGFWSQYWSQSNAANQYKPMDQYQIPANSTFNRVYREVYVGALSDLQFAIDESNKNENWPMFLMATVMQAYTWEFMTDLYGAIPYKEAFQGDAETQNFNPNFDSGEVIYDDLIARIDSALSKDLTQELTPAQKNADFLFGGEVSNWIKFANTLKLKMYMRQMYSNEAKAEAGVKALYTAGANFLDDDAALKMFVDAENKDNPLYASNNRKLNVATNLRISATIYDYFYQNNDPRLSYIVEDATQTNPMPQGGFNISSTKLDPTSVAVFHLGPTDPVYFISLLESDLLQAEAIAKGWGTGDDKALYDAAITNDFTRKGIATDTLTTLLGPGGVYEYPSAGTFEEKQEAIIMAKWSCMAGSQSAEAFFETNRTGYPRISTEPAWKDGAYNTAYVGGFRTYSLESAIGKKFPKRMIYPQDELNLNSNCPTQTKIFDKIWWDKK